MKRLFSLMGVNRAAWLTAAGICFLGGWPGEARAATYSWYGLGSSNNWTDSDNWIPNNAHYPGYDDFTGRNDVAVFGWPLPQSYTPVINANYLTIASIQFIDPGYTLRITSNPIVTNGISATYDTAPNLVNDSYLYFGGTTTVKSLTGTFTGGVVATGSPATLNVVGTSAGSYIGGLYNADAVLSLTVGDGTHAANLTLAPAGVPSDYSGPTLVNANATLIGAAANAFSTASAHTITGTLRLTAGNSPIGAFTGTGLIDLQGSSTLTATTTSTFDGTIGGSGSLAKSGTGTLTLTAVNTYTGGTTVSGGVLTISGAGTFGAATGAIAVNTGGTLDLAGFTRSAGAVTFAGGTLQNGALIGTSYSGQSGTVSAALAGSGVELTKTTAGTLTLTGASTYTGATTVSAGILAVNGSLANTAVFVAPGATLSGSGSIAGTVTLSNGGRISPGNSTGSNPGTLATGDETWFRGSSYNWQLNDASDAMAAKGVSYDWVNIGGSLTVTATLGTPLTLYVTSLTAGNIPGTTPNFVPGQTYQWTIATASGGIAGFDPDNVFINSADFANDPYAADAGRMTIAQSGNSIVLSYVTVPVPEPGILALLGLGGLAIGAARIRKRA